jgi:predicted O-methyltransferase YrrM
MRREQGNMWNIAPAEGEYFLKLVRQVKAKRILEIGTSNGYSGIWFAMGLAETGGKLITLEINRGRHELARQNFEAAGVAEQVDARLGDAFDLIPEIDGPLDIIFLDAGKQDYLKFYEMTLPKLRSGGVCLAHNTNDLGHSMRDFLERIKTDSRVTTEFRRLARSGFSESWKK